MLKRAAVPVLSFMAAAVAACSSAATSGQGQLDKDAVPERGYDAIVFMCPVPAIADDLCPAQATEAEVAALRAQLLDDPGVGALAYVSPDKALELFRIQQPDAGPLAQSGDLPASFLVTLPGSVGVADLTDRYASEPGVSVVRSCAGVKICLVSELRRVGVVR